MVAIGPTQLAFRKVKGLGLVYNKEATKDIQSFLNEETQKVLNLVTEGIILGAGKIVQILDDSSYNKKQDSYILTNLEDLLALERLVSAFKLEATSCLLVIMCEPVEGDVQRLFSTLNTVVQADVKKKVILITKKGENDSFQKILNTFSSGSNGPSGNHYKEISDEKNGFKDLDSKSQGNLQKSEISFQGKTMSLGQITTPEFLKEFICGKELLSLQDKKFKIGCEIPVVQYASIDRTFISRFIIKESELTDQDSSDIFTIIKAKSKTFSKLIPKNNVIELDEANPENHFKQVCELKKEHNIHYLSIEKGLKGKLILAHQKSRGSLCNLRQYINLNTGKDEDKEEFIERRLAILAGEPGTGKSSIMEQLCRLIKDKFPLLWVIKINLIECRSKLLKMDFNNNSLDQVVDFLSISRQFETPFERELFKYYLQQRDKVALLFDGFNEVGSVNEEKVLRLLKILRDLPGPCKLYVSVRSYIKDRLEDSLGIFSCELNPLQPKVQKSFLQYLLKKEISKSSNVDEKRISTFVGKLLKSCSETTNEAFGLDNPLCLKMLASFFAEEFQKFYNSENECDIRFDNFNFLNLYEYHLAHKICIHIDKNITIFSIEFAKLLNKSDLLHGKNLCKEKRYALETLSKYKNEFAAIFLEILFDEEKYSNQLKLGQEHKDDLHNIGTLHQCLYEYHVAKFFADECLKDLNNRDLRIFELLKKYYFHPDGEGMRHFFDLIVSRDCSLHVDVINGDFDKVKILIRSKNKDEEAKLLKLDPQDRSILHLVREGDYKKVADIVKEEAKSAKKGFTEGILCELIERKDKVFGYTSFEYAVRSGSWKIVEKFLELKGWFKKIGYVASVEQNMRLPTTSLDILQADSLIKSDLTLHKAIKMGYFYFALWMISMLELNNKLKAELEKEDSDGRKPLYYIMCENKAPHSPFHMLKLISNRVDLNKPDRFGQTAAHFLVLMMDKVKKKEDIFLKDHSMSFVLDILGIMKRNKVNMDVRDKSGNAPIHLVSDRLDIIEYLVEENLGVNLNLPRKDGKTLVHLAVIRGDCQMIQYLARRGASLNERDSDGNTPLHFTAMLSIQAPEGHNQSVALEIAEFLVGFNVDFNVANKEGKVPAEVAAGDVREYLRNLPTYEELSRDMLLHNVRHLQDLVVYKEEELDKVLLQLRRGVGVLLKLIDQQIGCVRNLRIVAIKLFYELRETDLPLPLVVEVVNSINDTLIKKLREQQLQELDNTVKELLLQYEQFVQLFGQSLLEQANILKIGLKISQLSLLLERMGKQHLEPKKWYPPTHVDFVLYDLGSIRSGIGEIQLYQIKFLGIVVRGKAVWPDYDGKKEREHCKKQLEALSLMGNPRVFVLDRIDSLRYLNRKEVRETKLLLVRDVQKELESIYDSLSDPISVYESRSTKRGRSDDVQKPFSKVPSKRMCIENVQDQQEPTNNGNSSNQVGGERQPSTFLYSRGNNECVEVHAICHFKGTREEVLRRIGSGTDDIAHNGSQGTTTTYLSQEQILRQINNLLGDGNHIREVDCLLTLEFATRNRHYDYWLQQIDIAHAGRLQYQLHTEGSHTFEVVNFARNDGNKHIVRILNQFRKNEEQQRLTLIITLNNTHWVTLVIERQNGSYVGYYADSTATAVPDGVTDIIQNNLGNNIRVNNVSVCQQTDDWNCGLWALENASDINRVLNENPVGQAQNIINIIRDFLGRGHPNRDRNYFQDIRVGISQLFRNNPGFQDVQLQAYIQNREQIDPLLSTYLELGYQRVGRGYGLVGAPISLGVSDSSNFGDLPQSSLEGPEASCVSDLSKGKGGR